MQAEFLSIGHICMDKVGEGYQVGGAAAYGGIATQQLGFQHAALTSFGADFAFANTFDKSQLHIIPSSKTTIFKNVAINGIRHQQIFQKASNIKIEQLPKNWAAIPMIHICPIANEVDLHFLRHFSTESLTCISPQGWMRQWNEDGIVTPKKIKDWSIFSGATFICISEEDINFDTALAERIAQYCQFLLLTKGENGVSLYLHNQQVHYPAFPTKVMDTTGAGDVFAASLMSAFFTSKNIDQSIRFAIASSSFSIASKGLSFSLNKAEIQERSQQI